jgi:hypothetical protein
MPGNLNPTVRSWIPPLLCVAFKVPQGAPWYILRSWHWILPTLYLSNSVLTDRCIILIHDLFILDTVRLVFSTRETREGRPLLAVQTEVNGTQSVQNERGPFLVGALDLSCWYNRFLFCLGCSCQSSKNYYFPHRTLFQSPSTSDLGRQACWVACLCVSGLNQKSSVAQIFTFCTQTNTCEIFFLLQFNQILSRLKKTLMKYFFYVLYVIIYSLFVEGLCGGGESGARVPCLEHAAGLRFTRTSG